MGKYYRLKVTDIISSSDNEIYVSSADDIKQTDSSYISLYGNIDYCLLAKKDFKNIKDKEIVYHVILSENIKIDDFNNLFDCLDVIKNDESILSLDFILSSKVSDVDFQKLINYIISNKHYFYIDFKLGNLEVFNNQQLEMLKKINIENEDIDMFLNINQSYAGNHIGNNEHDNLYEFDELIKIKQKISEIINKISLDYTDIEKVLFVYKYLGKKVKYDKKVGSMKTQREREPHDRKSLYYVLFNNKGVCSDIATTFACLMKAIGIECKSVMSVDHEWNVIKLNNKWYHLDLTGDLYNIKNDNPLEYFLKSENYMLKDKDYQFYSWYADEDEIAKKSVAYFIYEK